MTEWLGRRKHPRYPIVMPVLYGLKGAGPEMTGAGWTRDVGEGGACLELAERLDVSALLRLVLRTDQGRIATEARVIWTGGSPVTGGIVHGVAFAPRMASEQQALRELLLRKRMVWQGVVRIPVRLSVTYQLKGQPRSSNHGHTENASRRGLALRLPLAHPPGTCLEVTLHTSEGPLKVEGAIVRVDPLEAQNPGEPIRHGFHFTEISHAAQMRLGRILAEVR